MTTHRALALAGAGALLGLVAAGAAPAYAEEGGGTAGGLELPGEQVEQSSDQDDPTPVTAGAWRGDLGPYESADEARWFEYTRVTDESTVLVSVISPGAEPLVADGLELSAFTPAGDSCTTSSVTADRFDGDTQPFAAQMWLGVQEAALTAEEADADGFRCLNENRLLIRVGRTFNGEVGAAPFALRVVEEAPLEPDADLADPLARPEAEPPDLDSGREDLDGSSGLVDTPEAPGGRYRATVPTGSTTLYRVPDVAWGQTVRTSLDAGVTGLDDDVISGPEVTLQVLTPMWSPAGTSGVAEEVTSEDETVRLAASAGPVRYLNRRDDGEDRPTYLPGDHYVLLTVAPPDAGEPGEVDYTLEVDVTGEAEEAPAFTTGDPYLVAEGDEQEVVTAVGESGFLATAGRLGRYAGAALLAVGGLVALVGGVRTLRT